MINVSEHVYREVPTTEYAQSQAWERGVRLPKIFEPVADTGSVEVDSVNLLAGVIDARLDVDLKVRVNASAEEASDKPVLIDYPSSEFYTSVMKLKLNGRNFDHGSANQRLLNTSFWAGAIVADSYYGFYGPERGLRRSYEQRHHGREEIAYFAGLLLSYFAAAGIVDGALGRSSFLALPPAIIAGVAGANGVMRYTENQHKKLSVNDLVLERANADATELANRYPVLAIRPVA